MSQSCDNSGDKRKTSSSPRPDLSKISCSTNSSNASSPRSPQSRRICARVAPRSLCAIDQYSSVWPPSKVSELFVQALPPWLALTGFAFAVSLYCKLNIKRFQYHRILGLMAIAYLAAKLTVLLAPTIAFNLHNSWLAGMVLPGLLGAIGFAFVWTLLRYAARRLSPQQRLVVAGACSILAVTVVEIVTLHRNGETDRDKITELGVPLRSGSSVHQTPEDLVFDAALAIAESDERRIHELAKLEAARAADGDQSP